MIVDAVVVEEIKRATNLPSAISAYTDIKWRFLYIDIHFILTTVPVPQWRILWRQYPTLLNLIAHSQDKKQEAIILLLDAYKVLHCVLAAFYFPSTERIEICP